MSTLYQSSKDVPTKILAERLDELSDVVSGNRGSIATEFTMRIPAEVDRDADLVMSEASVRLKSLQDECDALVEALELALEYWGHRQQRYKNKRPEWVKAAEKAIAAHRKGGDLDGA